MRASFSTLSRKLVVLGFAFLFLVTLAAPALANDPRERFDTDLVYAGLPSPEPSALTGALTYTLPITVPPGRNGLQPDLKLQYNSQDTSHNSVFGAGWSDNIPYIQRLNKQGADKLYSTSTPYFYSSLVGELVATSTEWRAKVDDGAFLRFSTSSDTWIVKDKQGTTYTFGNATSTRQDNPSDSSKIFKWLLAEVEDPNGNSITYEYYKDAGQIYPSAIKYTHSATSTDGIFEVALLRESRSDNATSTATAFNVITNYRINEIQVKINGSLTRKYVISYTAGDNGYRSLINTITETGYDESGTPTSLPATDLDFQSTTNSWTENTSWTIPSGVHFTGWPDRDDWGVRLADVNGDALLDLVKAKNGSRSTYLNTGSGWTASSTWDLSLDIVDSSGFDRGVRLVDVDGDGFADVVRSINVTGTSTREVYLNDGSGWTLSGSWSIPLDFTNNSGDDFGVRLFDVNGDGLPDLVYAIDNSAGPDVQDIYLNTGGGWSYDSSWTIPSGVFFTESLNRSDLGIRMDDVNGDGLLDLLQSIGGTRAIYLNTGSGWARDNSWTIPVDFTQPYDDLGVRTGDVNGDGLADLVKLAGTATGSTRQVYINNGEGWTNESGWTIPSVVFVTVDGDDDGTRLADLNGDGLADLITLFQPNGGSTQKVYLNNHKVADAATRITYPQGGKKEVEYKPSPQYKDSSGNLLNPSLPFVLSTVATSTESDGLGLSSTKTYTYAKGRFYFNTYLDRKYSGFGQVTETNAAGAKTTTSYHGGTQNESSKGQYQDHISKAGKPYRVEVRDASNNLYSLDITKWDRSDLGNDANFVKLAQSVKFVYDGNTSHKEKAESTTYATTTGNILEKIQWGEVTGSDDGTFTDTGTDKFTSTFSYATNASSTVYKVSQETVTDQSANKVRESRVYYDNQSLGTLTLGNLTKEERWKTGSTYIDTEKTYDSYGLVIQEKDPRDKVTSYVHDGYKLYVATSTSPVLHTTDYYYDYSLGKPKKTVDPNNLIFETVFDGLDRVTQEKQPDLTATSTQVTKTAYTYTNETVGLKTQRTDYLNSATSTDMFTYTDGLGRMIQTRKEAEDSNTYGVTDVVYNNLGQVGKESLPYFATGTSRTTATTTAALFSTFSYDPLLRVTTVANAVGTTTNAYEDWKTTVTDPRGKPKHLYKDAYDNLWKVEEMVGSSTSTTQYEYNGNKNLTKITDASSNVRNFTYDGLGRRLTAQDLHAPADGTYGTWTYTYDDAGNLTQTADPKSQTINWTYDDINRVLTEDYTGQAGTEQTFTYDTCTNGKPRLCSVASATATTTLAYNPIGQVKQEVKTIGGVTYQTDYTHDRQGNTLTITNPDGSQMRYTHNSAGQLETIDRKEANDGSYTAVVTDFDYGPHGKVTYRENADATATTNTYDADKLYRLTTKLTSLGMGGDELSFWGGFDWSIFETEPVPEAEGSVFAATELASPAPAGPPVQRGWNYLATPLSVDPVNNTVQYKTAFHQKWIHYKTPSGWADINTDFSATKDGFVMKDAPFQVAAPLRSTGVAVMRNNNRWDVFAGREIYERPLDMSIQALAVNDVPGKLMRGDLMAPTGLQKNVSYVLYEGAYADGDLIYYVDFGKAPRLEKLIRFNSEPTIRSYSFNISYSDKVAFGHDIGGTKAQWDERAVLAAQKGKGLQVNKENSQIRGIGFKPFQIWDSNLDYLTRTTTRHIEPIDVDIMPRGSDSYTLTKVLPDSFFTPATVYPVYTDTTSTFYPDPNTETTSVDGFINSEDQASWDTAHDLSSGTADDISTELDIGSANVSGAAFWQRRGATLFDTASIPDADSIDSATVSLWATLVLDADNDGDDWVNVVQSSPASNTALAGGDYDQVGAVNNPTEGATRIDISSISTGAYTTWTLDSTGRGWISKTGVSKLGWREGHDALDSPIANLGTTRDLIRVYTADQAGTSNDPKLVVVHTTANQAPTAPTSLLAEGQTNPVQVIDNTPEMSAIYNDPNAGDIATHYRIQVATTTDFAYVYWDSQKTALSATTTEGTRIPDISYSGGTVASSTTHYWRIKFWDDDNAEGAWSTATSTFSLNSGPSEPSTLWTEGGANPTGVTDLTPEFSAIYNDSDTGDIATHYQIQVATSSSYWESPYWDSTKAALTATTTQGARIPDVSYAGSTLGVGATYYWRIKLWDDSSFVGSWSTSTASFTMATTTGSGLQNLTYTYDVNGNITQIVDTSATNSAKTTAYTYDDLNRLLTASTTLAIAGNNYSYTYTYDAIGNISSSTENGAYTYAGTNYANPHAVTGIRGTTYAYDNNGNLTSKGVWTYAWDYQNRMASAGNGTATSTYAYDHTGQRVSQTASGITTYYPTKYFNKTTATSTKHIFMPSGELIATVEGNGTATSTRYIHTDHLGGTGVVTDSNGNQVELLDYYPYGDARLNEGAFNEQRKFTGHEYDGETDLTYMTARYYPAKIGRFTSQDQAFLAVGDSNKLKGVTRLEQEKYLSNPQHFNSYSYAFNNPLVHVDEKGEFATALALPAFALLSPATLVVGSVAIAGATAWAVYEASKLQWGGPRQIPNVGLPPVPHGPEDLIPNMKPNVPKWAPWVAGGLLLADQIAEFYEKVKNTRNDAEDFKSKVDIKHEIHGPNGIPQPSSAQQSVSQLRTTEVRYHETGQFLQRTLDKTANQ